MSYALISKQELSRMRSLWGRLRPKIRDTILNRDNNTCQNCGFSPDIHKDLLSIKLPNYYHEIIPPLGLEIDHIIPLSMGGLNIEKNLQTLCTKCNYSKGNKLIFKLNKRHILALKLWGIKRIGE